MSDDIEPALVKSLTRILGRKKFHIIGLQFPEGLKRKAFEIADYIKRTTGADVIVSGDPCYGACDLAINLTGLGAEIILHFGHTKIGRRRKDKNGADIYYIECGTDMKLPENLINDLCTLIEKGECIGLLGTVQSARILPVLRKRLEARNIMTFIGKPGKRVKYKGQILGCDILSARSIADSVDRFVYLGSGEFHPLGVAIATAKDVIICDTEKCEIRVVSGMRDRFLRRRWAVIQAAMQCAKFGIIVSTKSGQNRLSLAWRLVTLAEKKGKKAIIVATREVTPDILLSLGADVYVSTACPRIATDDSMRYNKPFLTPIEMEIALGFRKWENYQMDEM